MDGETVFDDEHAGKGGSYVVGEDGKRVLQERTETNPEGAVPTKPATKQKPTVKGDSNV